MGERIVFTLNGAEDIELALCDRLDARRGEFEERSFPDGETYVRVLEKDVTGKHAVILCGLEHPDERFLPLWFLASTLRELGVASVGLVTPYLAYMRQDRSFHAGEGVTSRYFAGLLSVQFDWLATVDPHLHRYHDLNEIYSIPSRVVHAAPLLAGWLSGEKQAFLVGPDRESEQWVSDIASQAGMDYVIATKERFGDRDVRIHLPDLSAQQGKTPVLVDDIVSSGATMQQTLVALRDRGFESSTCLCVHGLFAAGADKLLTDAGARRLVSSNTIEHESNGLDVGPLLANAVAELMA